MDPATFLAFGAMAVVGLVVAVVFLLLVLMGATWVGGQSKLRAGGRAAARSLDELIGEAASARYLPPDAPRGPVDQLRPTGTSRPHGS